MSAEDAEVTELAEHLRQRDEREHERERMMGARTRQALSCLGPLIKDLPATDTYLFAPQAVDAWRVLRDEDPETFTVYLSAVRAKCGNNIALLVSNRVGPPGAGSASRDPLPGYTLATIWEGYEPPRYLVKRLLSPGAVTVLFG